MSEVFDRYPEHTKLLERSDEHDAIQNFLDWVYEQGLDITDLNEVPVPAPLLVANYLGIDRQKFEAEKRAMLAELREGSK